MNIENIVASYIIIINVIAFILMGIDKRKAIKHKWRVSEKTLWITAIIGGSVGSIIGMRMFSHKTKHRQFTVGMPFILIIQVVALFFLLRMS